MEDSQRSESTICVGVLAGVRSSAGNLLPGSWTQLLAEIRLLSVSPFLIVTSRVADDYLWAEALNLGAYDVLAKPFDRTEVTRILSSAWLHWQQQYCVPTMSRKVMPTAPAA